MAIAVLTVSYPPGMETWGGDVIVQLAGTVTAVGAHALIAAQWELGVDPLVILDAAGQKWTFYRDTVSGFTAV